MKKRFAFVSLLIATIIWGSAFYYTLQEYRKYIAWLESPECPLIERLNYLYGWVPAYWGWNGGKYVCLTAPFLLVTWTVFIAVALEKLSKRLSERKKPTVNPLEARSRLALIEGQKENKKKKESGKLNKSRTFGTIYVTAITIALFGSLYAHSLETLQPDFILEWSADEQMIVNGTLRIELTFEWQNESLNIIVKINDDEYHAADLLGLELDIDGRGWINCFAACNLTTDEYWIVRRWDSYYNAYAIGDILWTDGYFIRDPYSNCTFTEGVGYTYNITIPKSELSTVESDNAIVAFRDATDKSKSLQWWVSAEIEGWQ